MDEEQINRCLKVLRYLEVDDLVEQQAITKYIFPEHSPKDWWHDNDVELEDVVSQKLKKMVEEIKEFEGE